MKKLWILGLALTLGGCAAPVQHQTASGRPEVLIHNTNSESVKSAIVNRMLSDRYRITRDTPYEIAFDKAVENIAAQVLLGSEYDSQPNARISYTLASVGADVRVIADMAIITNPGSAFERRTEMNNGQDSPMVQTFLDGIKAEKEVRRPETQPVDQKKTATMKKTEPAKTAPKGTYVVQISSQRSEADAQRAFGLLQLKFPEQLRNRKPIIVKKSFADHGVYYRILVGPFTTAEEANDFCGNLQAAGGQCKAMLAAEAGDN
jgi:hypothetical protein